MDDVVGKRQQSIPLNVVTSKKQWGQLADIYAAADTLCWVANKYCHKTTTAVCWSSVNSSITAKKMTIDHSITRKAVLGHVFYCICKKYITSSKLYAFHDLQS